VTAALEPFSEDAAVVLARLISSLHRPLSSLTDHDIDALIAQIDRRVCGLIDAILHDSAFQALEATWRQLRLLVDRLDFSENIALSIFDTTKSELLDDFEDATDVVRSALYKIVYRQEFGVLGGQPYGLVVLDFEFGPEGHDIDLLDHCAMVGAISHALVVSNASPSLLGLRHFGPLGDMRGISAVLQQPGLTRFRNLRTTPDARYLGLCLPRILMRRPYYQSDRQPEDVVYTENVVDGPQQYLWGRASTAFILAAANSFALYRWCPHIVGPDSGGRVTNLLQLPHAALPHAESRIITETLIPPEQEPELARMGLIPFLACRGTSDVIMFSAHSVQAPPEPTTGLDASTAAGESLGAQLPYLFIVTRIAHYLKIIQRQRVGITESRSQLEKELSDWLRELVSAQDSISIRDRQRKPLRRASVALEEVPGEIGWYRCQIEIQPHLRYLGASFRLSLVGKLDRTA
jgi:type VI secretion system protein ImpC